MRMNILAPLVVVIIILIYILRISDNKSNTERQINYADAILQKGSDDKALISILEIIQKKCGYGERLNDLTESEKVIYLIGDVEGEVNNGGFSQYFFNSSGRNVQEAIRALKVIGASYTASLLGEAMGIYRNGLTNDNRNEPEQELTPNQEAKLNDLDNEFYKYKENLSQMQLEFIKKNSGDYKRK